MDAGADQRLVGGTFLALMIAPVFLFLACSAALPKFDIGEPRDMAKAYGEEQHAFFLFFLLYQGGNWIATLLGISRLDPILLIHRTGICVVLVVLLFTKARRWDWIGVVAIAALYAMRISMQVAR